ncbi:MAG TPA: hypothetical protein VE442_03355 [Jatrophihabitans sp.]|jgi:hypothetical protein|nr:hypothetical protein [Jatrophihabitans sp.]
MSRHRRDQISRVDAERLLDTGVGGPDALEALLAAATAAPPVGEVAGQRAALAEFRAAHLTTVPTRRRLAMLKSVLANFAAAKVVLSAAAAAAATGGIAIAAATGALPGTSHGDQHAQNRLVAPTSASAQSSHSAAANSAASSRENEPASEASESAATHGSATPSPSLPGLCNAYQRGVAASHGKALENPAFSVLIAKAGSKDNVAAYCDNLVGPAPSHPAGGAETTHPTGPPASHPAGPPNHPTGAPETHPTGAPSAPDRP